MARPQPRPVGGAKRAPTRAAEALAQLFQFLQAEGGALIGGDADALARAVNGKEQALQRLATCLTAADASALRVAVRRARDLNERNARLLMPHLRMNRSRVEALFGGQAGTLYSPDGRAAAHQEFPAQRGVRA